MQALGPLTNKLHVCLFFMSSLRNKHFSETYCIPVVTKQLQNCFESNELGSNDTKWVNVVYIFY